MSGLLFSEKKVEDDWERTGWGGEIPLEYVVLGCLDIQEDMLDTHKRRETGLQHQMLNMERKWFS